MMRMPGTRHTIAELRTSWGKEERQLTAAGPPLLLATHSVYASP